MNAETRRELEHLRARAFGPDADIHDDHEALQRLQQLEELSRPVEGIEAPAGESFLGEHGGGPSGEVAAGDEVSGEAAPGDAASGSEAEGHAASGHAAAGSEAEGPAHEDEQGRPRLLGQRLLWIGSAVLVAVVAVAATLSVTSIAAISTNPNARHVGTAAASDSAPWPPAFGDQGEGIVYEDFAGFTAVLQGSNINGYEDLRCMIVLRTEDVEPSSEGFRDSFYGCGAGDFPVSAVVPITGSAPDDALERFSEGSVLQFVVNGDRVDVFSDDD